MVEKVRNRYPHIEKRVEHGDVYYLLFWSGLRKAEKYDILRHVPSVAGMYELYYMDEEKRIHLMRLSRAWYGGLRSKLRFDTDPELVMDPEHRRILEKYDIYYRYTMTDSMKDMLDVLHFFSKTYFPARRGPDDSGRYGHIFLEEIAPNKLVTI